MKSALAGVSSVVLLLVGACGHPADPRPSDPLVQIPSSEELAQSLPTLADYPGAPWDVTMAIGSPESPAGPQVYPADAPVEPTGCGDIPFQRKDQIAAASEGSVPNGIAGDSGRASVRIMRERPGTDLIAESVDWAKRCHEYRVIYPGSGPPDPETVYPTAVSVMPPKQVDGVELTRIHLTDNRAHRFQPEGSRESMVLLARAQGLVLVGVRHDSGQTVEDLLALTLKRLESNKPAPKPLPDRIDTSELRERTDKELQQLLPSALDAPREWSVRQSSPIIRDGEEDGEGASGCSRVPFEDSVGWRTDLHRNFREIAAVSALRTVDQHNETETARFGVEHSGASVIDETTMWAKGCGYPITPTESLGDVTGISVHVKGEANSRIDYTASLMRVRGLLVITKPALGQQSSQIARHLVTKLQHAQFDTAPNGPEPTLQLPDPSTRPPGDVAFPTPSAEATTKLARIGQGTLVDTASFHVGGYLPTDTPTRSSDDYLHFSSPTGSIACTWRKYSLFCDVPQGTYARTPKPAAIAERWQDSVTSFGWGGLQNGVAAEDPVVYAVSNELPYGSTIRLQDNIECLMENDGLTCVDYARRKGFHLSRDDLTPLSATGALANDTRPQPK
ncbi:MULTISPECIES: hypothetical protein [Mycobacteroides]|uniref:hypothetical protein n=1 Tax=Mycobacteroides TaxID=670516 RepID=UPI0009291EEC|nr:MULTISPECIES: hypothetical protein [Mycobacteroides]MBE5465019.1 hypothetical protein [Mycobacteroides abscessus]SIN50069.1 Uncharacterised protein [Mycobacteroides abscessus subsp. abscessus]SKH52809.1 Uncharacterised protein [Mycobacteroides abscessus subsp. abscessus]